MTGLTQDEFREIALSLPGATESAHMHHPDFRAHGRIFATLGHPNAESGMVKLSPQDQQRFVALHGHAFTPVKGAWGLQGCTTVHLAAAQRDVVAEAMHLAWERSAVALPKPAKKSATQKARPSA